MTTPYFPPPPSNTTTSRRKRLSFPALPSPSEAFAPFYKSRLALQKKIAANRFSASSSNSSASSSASTISPSPLSPTSWQFDTSRHPQHHKAKKESISRPIISPTRAKPPVDGFIVTSGRVVAVGLPCSPRMGKLATQAPNMATRPPPIAEQDLSVYAAFDPRPLPGPPPLKSLPRSPRPPARMQLMPVPIIVDTETEQDQDPNPEAYYDVRYDMTQQLARMSDAQVRGQGSANAQHRRKQPPKPLALTASKESQWEVMSAPPVMVPRYRERQREEVEVPIRLEDLRMDISMQPVGVWEGVGARRVREL